MFDCSATFCLVDLETIWDYSGFCSLNC